jgi:hypothetical protein
MADTKISALPASTTPLAGTEVLPIVQGGATKQVSVANLTAGRAISATQLTLTTGNVIVASGQGIDFSATPGTGTSELLADYEEGTHTATVTPGTSGTVSLLAGNTLLAYTKVGRLVTITGNIVADVVVLPIGYFDISLPFVVADLPEVSGRSAATITMQSTVLSNISDFVSIMPETLSVIRVYLGNASTVQATSAQQIKQYTEMFISASYFTT